MKTFLEKQKSKSFYCSTFAIMEKIIHHIENLLIRNDFVIIPGLGGFVLQEQPAQITSQGILPPHHTVGFNVRMDNNDGLLATELLRAEKISYRSAMALVNKEIAKAKQTLYAGGCVKIGRLGTLKLDAEKQIVYIPAATLPVFPCDFGLYTLHPVRSAMQKKATKTITISLPTTRHMLRYAASILIIISVLLFPSPIGDSELPDFAGINNPLALFESGTTVSQQNVEEVVLPETTEAAPKIQSEQPTKNYHIVVSCLSNRTSADRFCELLQAKHYDNARVLPSIRTNRIVIESFSSRDIAVLYLNELREKHAEFKDAWLYHTPSH